MFNCTRDNSRPKFSGRHLVEKNMLQCFLGCTCRVSFFEYWLTWAVGKLPRWDCGLWHLRLLFRLCPTCLGARKPSNTESWRLLFGLSYKNPCQCSHFGFLVLCCFGGIAPAPLLKCLIFTLHTSSPKLHVKAVSCHAFAFHEPLIVSMAMAVTEHGPPCGMPEQELLLAVRGAVRKVCYTQLRGCRVQTWASGTKLPLACARAMQPKCWMLESTYNSQSCMSSSKLCSIANRIGQDWLHFSCKWMWQHERVLPSQAGNHGKASSPHLAKEYQVAAVTPLLLAGESGGKAARDNPETGDHWIIRHTGWTRPLHSQKEKGLSRKLRKEANLGQV